MAGILMLLASGCCRSSGSLVPDEFVTGVVVRTLRGNVGQFTEDVAVPLVRLQGNYHLTDELDLYARADLVNGKVTLNSGRFSRNARGDMQSLGVGLSYAPFTEYIRFELGGAFDHVDFATVTKFGPLEARVSDSVYGWVIDFAVNAGIPITSNFELLAGVGYVIGNHWTSRIDMDLDAIHWFVGARIDLN